MSQNLAADADLGVSVGNRVAVGLVLRSAAYEGKLVVYCYTLGLDVGSGLWGGYGEYDRSAGQRDAPCPRSAALLLRAVGSY